MKKGCLIYLVILLLVSIVLSYVLQDPSLGCSVISSSSASFPFMYHQTASFSRENVSESQGFYVFRRRWSDRNQPHNALYQSYLQPSSENLPRWLELLRSQYMFARFLPARFRKNVLRPSREIIYLLPMYIYHHISFLQQLL